MRKAITLTLGLALSGCQAHAPAPVTQAPPTLAQAAARTGRLCGTEVDSKFLGKDAAYTAVVSREFSILVPQNEMKFGWIAKRGRGKYDFTDADGIVRFAENHGLKMRGHCLAWHRNLPKWLTAGSSTSEELKSILLEHIAIEVTHFRGQLVAWDVVNEALGSDGKARPESIWGKIGDAPLDYVSLAFRAARAADPHAELFYNDYSIESLNSKSDGVYALVASLRSRGVPIDGVGFQFHLDQRESIDFGSVRANLLRFAKLGVKIQVTELDDAIPLPLSAANLESQATIYRDVTRACLSTPPCEAVLTWGFTDAHSWIPDFTHGVTGAATLFDESYRPKPAYAGMLTGWIAP